MKSIKECIKESKKFESRVNQLINLINNEYNFFKGEYKKLKTPGKIFLLLEIIIFIFGIISFIVGTLNFIKNGIFYIEGFNYISNCDDTVFRLNNKDKCNEYSKTWFGKYFIKERIVVKEEEIVKKSIPTKHFVDILKLSPKYEENKYRIKESESELDMGIISYLNNTVKQSTLYEDRRMIDGYFKIHTIGKTLEEKTIIFTLHPYCYGDRYDGSFNCPLFDNFDMPINIKLTYCENGKVINDIFDDCE